MSKLRDVIVHAALGKYIELSIQMNHYYIYTEYSSMTAPTHGMYAYILLPSICRYNKIESYLKLIDYKLLVIQPPS